MSDYRIVYLIVERGNGPHRQAFWRSAGAAYVCRDGSLNVRLDIHPGLTFNIRDPKSIGEREEAEDYRSGQNGHVEQTGLHNGKQPEPANTNGAKPTVSANDERVY
jgi:hypothetical protein